MSSKLNACMVNVDDDFENAIRTAKELYLKGTVFIYPTDTIYGFGANPFNEDAVVKINDIKGRKSDKRYILLIDSIDTLMKYIEVQSESHLDFLLSIWPNPVSVVLKLNNKTKNLMGFDTAAFRVPHHRFCQKLLAEIKMPLISTSVNRSDSPPLTDPEIIKEEFAHEVDAIFYTEKKSFFQASTLIDLSNSAPVLIREGRIKFKDLLKKFH